MSTEAWVAVTSDGRDYKVELVIRDELGDEVRYQIPNISSVHIELLPRTRAVVQLTVEARIGVRTQVRTDMVSAEDLLAEIAADKLVGKFGRDEEDK